MSNLNPQDKPETDCRILVRLSAPGFLYQWLDTPERIQKLIELAGRCIVAANAELTPNDQNQTEPKEE